MVRYVSIQEFIINASHTRTDFNIIRSGRSAHGVYKRCSDITDDVDGYLIVDCCSGDGPKQQVILCQVLRRRVSGGRVSSLVCFYVGASKEVKVDRKKITNL